MYRFAITLCVLASGLTAQDFVYLTGFSQTGGPPLTGDSFPAARFRDLNGDMMIDDNSELFTFLDTSFNVRNGSGSFMTDLKWIEEGQGLAFYFCDSADGRITRGVDANNNGQLEGSEVTEFADLGTSFAPEGLAVRRDATLGRTVVYVANDDQSSQPGIHRLVDLDGNGSAMGAGEASVIVSPSSGLSVAGTAGPVAIANHWWFSIEVLPSGKIVAYNAGPSKMTGGGGGAQTPDMFCWYSFTDNAGTPANFQVHFNPTQLNGIATHPDFAVGGQFPQWDIALDQTVNSNLHPTYSEVRYFTQNRTSSVGIPTYYFGSTYRDQATAGFTGFNPGGMLVSGLFYRWLDSTTNEQIDPGELTLFANISNQMVAGVAPFTYQSGGTPIATLNDAIFGIRATDDELHLCWDLSGPGAKGVVTMNDTNGNGVIETGEARQSYVYSGASPMIYSAMFGPFIKAFTAIERGVLPGPFGTGYSVYGRGCAQPGSGQAPVADATGGLPSVGNSGFGLSAIRVDQGTGAALLTGFGRANLGLGGLGRPQCSLLVSLPAEVFGPFLADRAGVASIALPIPNTPALMGGVLNTQWATLTNGVIATSNGLEVTIQP